MSRLRIALHRLLQARIRVATLLYVAAVVGLIWLASWLAPLRYDDVQLAPGQEEGGALIIVGGGDVPASIERRFLRLAGGREARLVIVPTAHYNADEIDPTDSHFVEVLRDWRALGVADVKFLHTRSRERANDDEFVEPLTQATGVWFEGGEQEWLTRPYINTLFEEELRNLLERGGVIGGNSAGAACMTRVMIAAGRQTPREGEGFDLFPGAVIDQHFLKRNRLKRLLDVLAGHTDLVGFGIDERTALLVRVRDMRITVIGESYVVAYVPETPERAARIEVLQPGDITDLTALRESENPVASIVEADENLAPEKMVN